MIAAGSLAGVRVYFPDPGRRRAPQAPLLQPAFVAVLASRLHGGP